MSNFSIDDNEPKCPLFGKCGGCFYQDKSYVQELAIKQNHVSEILMSVADISSKQIDPIVASPKHYHYRNRIFSGDRITAASR